MNRLTLIGLLMASILGCPDDRMCTACVEDLSPKSACRVCTPWAYNSLQTNLCEQIPEGELYQDCLAYKSSGSAVYRCDKCSPGFGIAGFEKYPCNPCKIAGCSACEWKDKKELCFECFAGKVPSANKKLCEDETKENKPCNDNCERCGIIENRYQCQVCKPGFVRENSTGICAPTQLDHCLVQSNSLCLQCTSDAYLDQKFKCHVVLSPYRNSKALRIFYTTLIGICLILAVGYCVWRLRRNKQEFDEEKYQRAPGEIGNDGHI